MKPLFAAFFSLIFISAEAQLNNFSLPNAVNGKNVTLDTYSSSSALVIIFTSNACPFDEYYRGRINKLSKDFDGRVPVLLVNSHTDANESLEAMTKKVQQLGISVPYLADKDQIVMQNLKATKSPQSFVLKNSNGKFTVVYNGAIDDNAQVEGDVRTSYLRDAVNAVLGNQAITAAEIRPAGCSIKKR